MIRTLIKGIAKRAQYSISVEDSSEHLQEIFKLRYRSYCLEEKFLDAREYPAEAESDKCDLFAYHIVARDRKGRIVGYLRLIPSDRCAAPTEEAFKLGTIREKYADKFAEISRLILLKEFRSTLLFLDLLSFSYHYSISRGLLAWIGSVEEWMITNIRKYIGDVTILGEPQYYFNTLNYPFVIQLDSIPKKIASSSRLLNLFFMSHKKSAQRYARSKVLE